MNYFNTCKQHILNNIGEYEGKEIEVSDFGMTLTEGENANGSYYCSTYKAEQDLKEWISDISDFREEYKDNFGEYPKQDSLGDAESFHCLMMIIGVEKLFNSLECIQNLWNEKATLNKKLIKKIVSELETMTDFN